MGFMIFPKSKKSKLEISVHKKVYIYDLKKMFCKVRVVHKVATKFNAENHPVSIFSFVQ